MTKQEIEKIFKCAVHFYNKRQNGDDSHIYLPQYHYTSLTTLFSILENDSIWASSSRFSNDLSEEKLLDNNLRNIKAGDLLETCKIVEQYTGDNYIFCLTNDSDQLSQWRGYCPNGGAAIEFDFSETRKFSILSSNYDATQKLEYITLNTRAIPVIYIKDEYGLIKETIKEIYVKLENDHSNLFLKLMPFLKNGLFIEENESRVVFSNTTGDLSSCIRFKTKNNGVKVPYIVVKSGDIGKNNRKITEKIDRENILDYIKNNRIINEIYLPQGSDQEYFYYKFKRLFDEIDKKSLKDSEINNLRIFCKGHLPIKKIIVAPTHDRARVAEQIKRFCQSKYWLQSVEVSSSKIPYISSFE